MFNTLAPRLGKQLTPFQFFCAVFGLSSFGGLAAELQSRRKITGTSILSATLYSGLTGVTIALLLYSRFGESDPFFLAGVASLAGIGGVNMAHLLVKALVPAVQQALLAVLKAKADDPK